MRRTNAGGESKSKVAPRLAEKFDAEFTEELHPRYNIAPTQSVATIRIVDARRLIASMRWGLIPHWTLLAKSHMTCPPSRANAEVRVGAGRIPLE